MKYGKAIAWAAATWGAVVGILPVGCRDEAPPPRYAGEFSESGTPIPVSFDKEPDKSILGPAGGSNEPEAGPYDDEPATGDGRDSGTDQSTARGVVEAFVAYSRQGRISAAAALLVPEQRVIAVKAATGMERAIAGARHLESAWEEKFPGQKDKLKELESTTGRFTAGDPSEPLRIVSVEENPGDPDLASAEIENEETGEAEQLAVRRIDGRWWISHPDFEDADDPMAGQMMAVMVEMFGKAGEVLQGIADRIEADEFATADEAIAALQEAMQQMGDAAGGPPGG